MRDANRRRFIKTVATTAMAAGIAGCTGSNDGNGGNGNGDSDNTNLTLWWIDADSEQHAPFNNYLEETIEQETGQSVELTGYAYSDMRQNFITGGRTGTPDVIEGVIEHPGDYVAADLLEPLTDRTDEIPHFDGFIDSAVDAFRFQDELWALPYTGNGRGLIYRKDILAEYGYEDGPPVELDEFFELASTIHEDHDEINGYHMTTERGEVRVTQEFLSHLYQEINSNLYEWDGDNWELQASQRDIEVILADIYYEMYHGSNSTLSIDYRGSGWETNDVGFTEGEHAMIHCGPWIETFRDTEEQQEILDEYTAVSLLPRHADATDATYLEVKPIMINTHSDQIDDAVTAASVYSSPAALEALSEADPGSIATPVHEDLESTIESEDFRPFIDAFENGVAPAPIGWGNVRDPIYTAIEEVIYEEQDPADAASDLETQLLEADVELDPEA